MKYDKDGRRLYEVCRNCRREVLSGIHTLIGLCYDCVKSIYGSKSRLVSNAPGSIVWGQLGNGKRRNG